MTKPIPFPKNFDFYLQSAMESFHSGELDVTIDYLLKAISIQMDDDVFNFCLTLLQEQNKFEEAITLLRKYKSYLFESNRMEADDVLMMTLLIQSDRLEEAKKQIFQRNIQIAQSDSSQYFYDILEQNMRIIEEKEATKQKQLNQLIVEESKLIATKNYYLQIDFIKKMNQLSEEAFFEVSEELLVNEAIHPLLKTEILQLVLENNNYSEIKVRKNAYMASISLSKLYLIHHSPFYLRVMELVEEADLSFEDKDRLRDNLFLHTAYFYPFEQQAFPSSEEWIDFVLKDHYERNKFEQTLTEKSIVEVEHGLNSLTDL